MKTRQSSVSTRRTLRLALAAVSSLFPVGWANAEDPIAHRVGSGAPQVAYHTEFSANSADIQVVTVADAVACPNCEDPNKKRKKNSMPR